MILGSSDRAAVAIPGVLGSNDKYEQYRQNKTKQQEKVSCCNTPSYRWNI